MIEIFIGVVIGIGIGVPVGWTVRSIREKRLKEYIEFWSNLDGKKFKK